MEDRRYLVSYLARLEPVGFIDLKRTSKAYIPMIAVIDVTLTSFIIYMRTLRHTKIIPLHIENISLTEAAELVNGGGDVKVYFIEGDS